MKVFVLSLFLLCLTVTRGAEMQCFACALAAADEDQCSIGDCEAGQTQCYSRAYTENEEKIVLKGCANAEIVESAVVNGDELCEGTLCNAGSTLTYSMAVVLSLSALLLLH